MELSESWKWLIGTAITAIVSVSGALSLNKWILNRQKHTSEIDKQEINFDQYTFRLFVGEVKELKKELKEAKDEIKQMQKDLNSQQVANGILETENKHLKEDNGRLRERVQHLEQELKDTKLEFQSLKQQLDFLQKDNK